jgi:hypothetical protein
MFQCFFQTCSEIKVKSKNPIAQFIGGYLCNIFTLFSVVMQVEKNGKPWFESTKKLFVFMQNIFFSLEELQNVVS